MTDITVDVVNGHDKWKCFQVSQLSSIKTFLERNEGNNCTSFTVFHCFRWSMIFQREKNGMNAFMPLRTHTPTSIPADAILFNLHLTRKSLKISVVRYHDSTPPMISLSRYMNYTCACTCALLHEYRHLSNIFKDMWWNRNYVILRSLMWCHWGLLFQPFEELHAFISFQQTLFIPICSKMEIFLYGIINVSITST